MVFFSLYFDIDSLFVLRVQIVKERAVSVFSIDRAIPEFIFHVVESCMLISKFQFSPSFGIGSSRQN